MYPILGPGTPDPRDPGLPPNTHISPEFNLRRPTIHDNSVVLPQPEAPRRPYLKRKRKWIKQDSIGYFLSFYLFNQKCDMPFGDYTVRWDRCYWITELVWLVGIVVLVLKIY